MHAYILYVIIITIDAPASQEAMYKAECHHPEVNMAAINAVGDDGLQWPLQ